MTSTFSGGARLKEELGAVIDSKELSLSGLQKNYLRSRWLEQAARADAGHRRALRGFYALRMTTVVCAITLPVLIALSLGGPAPGGWNTAARVLAVLAALLVSACVAVEQLFDVGGRYRRSERVAGRLLAEGWRFLQLSGPYASYDSHSDAFPAFANQVEALSQPDVEVYNFDVIHERGAASEAWGVEAPKKFGGSRQQETEPVEPPLLMTGAARSRQSYHQTR
jgi:hypothetical protein